MYWNLLRPIKENSIILNLNITKNETIVIIHFVNTSWSYPASFNTFCNQHSFIRFISTDPMFILLLILVLFFLKTKMFWNVRFQIFYLFPHSWAYFSGMLRLVPIITGQLMTRQQTSKQFVLLILRKTTV